MNAALGQGEGRKLRQLSELLLDSRNPRFGGMSKGADQTTVLEHIVDTFGVDDLLSSLAVNGYFEAEPLVVRNSDEGLVVAEGNRRLAACLMILGDPRARRVEEKSARYRQMWLDHGSPSINPVPTIQFEGNHQSKELISYLGVRHISASRSWDSYAKAAWVAEVVEQHNLNVRDIAAMIGDQHKTVDRLLQGYYLVKQLERAGQFRPADSLRAGRGSVTDYPFSWVYTVLGYSAARRYLDLPDGESSPAPLAEAALPRGAVLMKSMFGDKQQGRNSAVTDSRQLGAFASMLVDPEKLTMLEQGKTVDEIQIATQPLPDKLRLGIQQVRDTLRDLVAGMDEAQVDALTAESLVTPAGGAVSLSQALQRKLQEAAALLVPAGDRKGNARNVD